MQQKSIDQYFESARQLPLAMSFEEVQALVKIKGTTSINQHRSWWNLKNFIFMTTAILITTTVLLFSSTNNTSSTFYPLKKTEKTIFNNTNESIKTASNERKASKNTHNVQQEIEPVASKKNVSFLIEEANDEQPTLNLSPFSFNKNYLPLIENDSIHTNDEDYTKVITQEISTGGINLTKAVLTRGNINVETWDKPFVQLKVYIDIENDNEEEKKLLLDNLKIELIAKGDKIEVINECVSGDDCYCNCSSTTISGKKKNKKVKKSSSKIKVDYEIKVPRDMNLDLNGSYGNITIPNMNSDVAIKSFQGDFYGGKIDGKLNLNSRYGKVEVSGFNSGVLTLFQSKGNLGVSKVLELNAKYAQLKVVNTKDLTLEAFQSNIEIQESVEKIKGSFKYGDLILLKNVGNIKLTAFQTKIVVNKIERFDIDGSYSSVKSEAIDNLILSKSFQTNFEIGTLRSVKGEAKYSNFSIKQLNELLNLTTFQGDLKIDYISADFKDVNIDSKYTPIELNFSPEAKYSLNAQTTYANLSYPEQKIEFTHQKKELNKNEMKGVFNAKSNKTASLVNLVCFQGKVTLR
ncbi:MAG: hypothetical protein H6587_10475 [Flavobacteriales bacterium]|nr:hypothetical protein [Flavobacteriales bacterium]MCB9364985.1 hypothetical protein [Flavobacteriales bacterium]